MNSNDLRPGITIVLNKVLHEILENQHVKPGKGPAFVKAKVKNLITGSIFEHTFRAKEPVEQAIVEKTTLQYLYQDRDLYYFMDSETYEQTPINKDKIAHCLDYLKENEPVHFMFFDGQVIDAKLPDFVNLEVTEALPGVKGDTASGGSKPVTLETGKVIQVPLFIKQGEFLKIDTRTGRYVERVKN